VRHCRIDADRPKPRAPAHDCSHRASVTSAWVGHNHNARMAGHRTRSAGRRSIWRQSLPARLDQPRLIGAKIGIIMIDSARSSEEFPTCRGDQHAALRPAPCFANAPATRTRYPSRSPHGKAGVHAVPASILRPERSSRRQNAFIDALALLKTAKRGRAPHAFGCAMRR